MGVGIRRLVNPDRPDVSLTDRNLGTRFREWLIPRRCDYVSFTTQIDEDVSRMSAADRFKIVWQLTLDAYAFRGAKDLESPLLRDTVRVLREGVE
jgi:hypothetical protein